MVDLMGQEGPEAVTRLMRELGQQARAAAAALARATPAARDAALDAAAALLRERAGTILEANAEDVAAGEERGLSAAMLDRLRLDDARVEAMAAGIEAIARAAEPARPGARGVVRGPTDC